MWRKRLHFDVRYWHSVWWLFLFEDCDLDCVSSEFQMSDYSFERTENIFKTFFLHSSALSIAKDLFRVWGSWATWPFSSGGMIIPAPNLSLEHPSVAWFPSDFGNTHQDRNRDSSKFSSFKWQLRCTWRWELESCHKLGPLWVWFPSWTIFRAEQPH